MYNANCADEKEKRKIETEGKSGQEKELMMNETRLHAEIREIIYSQIFHCVNDVRAQSDQCWRYNNTARVADPARH